MSREPPFPESGFVENLNEAQKQHLISILEENGYTKYPPKDYGTGKIAWYTQSMTEEDGPKWSHIREYSSCTSYDFKDLFPNFAIIINNYSIF